MFELATFAVGSVLLGILVTLIAAIAMLLCVPFLFGKQHTPMSYVVTVLFALILLVLNITFAGLVNSKEKLIEYQHSYEYNLMQKGTSMLEQISPELSDFANALLGTDENGETIEYQISRINKYLWIDGALCIVLFVIGIGVVSATAGSGKVRQNRSYSDRGRSSHTGHRGDEFNGRRRHRQ